MKHSDLFIPFLLLLAVTTCAQDSVKFAGYIQHPLDKKISISFNDNYLAYYPKNYSAAVDKNGYFKMTFPFPAGSFVQAEITHGDKLAEVLLQAGDSLVLSVNAQHFDSSIHYKGRGGDIQNFVALHTIARGRMNQYTLKIKAAVSESPDTFLTAINKEYLNETNYLAANGKNLPKPFINYWKAYYRYYNNFFMQQYPQMHEIARLKRFTDTIPPANYAVPKEMPLAFNDSLLKLPPYLLYLTGVLETHLKTSGFTWRGRDTTKAHLFEDSVMKLAYTMLPSGSAEYYVAQNIYGRAKTQLLSKTEAQFARFKKQWPASSYLPIIGKQVALAERLAPGQPAPDFDIITPDGQHKKLSDFKGKVVYLGFWAGWCRQCVGEMISEKKIKELIRNKPLELVYESIGNDTATEHTLTERYKIPGTYTSAKGGWESKEVQLYGVQNLPAFYLIDEDGNFALQAAPYPSQTVELVLAIEKLFK